MAQRLRCSKPVCSHLEFATFKRYLNHLRNTHSHEADFKVTCTANGCFQTFTVFSSFTSHLSRKHRDVDIVGDLLLQNEIEVEEVTHAGNEFSDSEDDNEDEHIQGEHEEYSLRSLALYVLKTQEMNRLSDTSLNANLDNTDEIVEQNLEFFKVGVKRCLQDANLDVGAIQGMEELLESPSAMSKHLEVMKSAKHRNKYLVEELEMVGK